VLRTQRLRLYSPNNMRRIGDANQGVRAGWKADWSGYGTFKQQTLRESTGETGKGVQRMAVARSRGIPLKVKIVPGSWHCAGPDGTMYEVVNAARTGSLVTLNLVEAVEQHGDL
jgi:hypothetical protein